MCSDFVFALKLIVFSREDFSQNTYCAVPSWRLFLLPVLFSHREYFCLSFHFLHAFSISLFSKFFLYLFSTFFIFLKLATVSPLISVHVHNYVHEWEGRPWDMEKLDANRCGSKVLTFPKRENRQTFSQLSLSNCPPILATPISLLCVWISFSLTSSSSWINNVVGKKWFHIKRQQKLWNSSGKAPKLNKNTEVLMSRSLPSTHQRDILFYCNDSSLWIFIL